MGIKIEKIDTRAQIAELIKQTLVQAPLTVAAVGALAEVAEHPDSAKLSAWAATQAVAKAVVADGVDASVAAMVIEGAIGQLGELAPKSIKTYASRAIQLVPIMAAESEDVGELWMKAYPNATVPYSDPNGDASKRQFTQSEAAKLINAAKGRESKDRLGTLLDRFVEEVKSAAKASEGLTVRKDKEESRAKNRASMANRVYAAAQAAEFDPRAWYTPNTIEYAADEGLEDMENQPEARATVARAG